MWTKTAVHQPTCSTLYYPLLISIVMHTVAWDSAVGVSAVRLCPWQWFRRGVIRWYVLSTSNQCIPIKNKFIWFFVCVLCMRISVVIFCLSSAVHKFDFRFVINWTRTKCPPVRSDGHSDGDLSTGFMFLPQGYHVDVTPHALSRS